MDDKYLPSSIEPINNSPYPSLEMTIQIDGKGWWKLLFSQLLDGFVHAGTRIKKKNFYN